MRVLMLTQFYPPVIGGQERHVANLGAALAGRGHEVHVATLLTRGETPAADHDGVRVHTLESVGRHAGALFADATRPQAPPVPDPVVVAGLRRLVDTVRPDVVHAHDWIVNSYLPLKRRAGVPLLVTLHDYGHACATRRMVRRGETCPGPSAFRCLACASRHYDPARGPVLWAAVRAGVRARQRLVDRFLPVSRAVAVRSGLPGSAASWEVVPNFVPDDLLNREAGARPDYLPDGPFLFFAGDLSADKGVPTLLAAYRQLDPRRRPALLAVGRPAGGEPADPPAGAVVETGWPHERVVAGFLHCLAAVLPSEWPDPCPTTVLEALALGAPLVTTAEGGIADLVEAGRSALVVGAGDPAGLAAAMARLAEDGALRRRLGEQGRRRVTEFLQGRVVERIEAAYRSVLAEARAVGTAGMPTPAGGRFAGV